MKSYNTLISLLKENRKAKKITQKELAEAIGCDLKTINRIENGRQIMNLEMFLKAAKVLGIDVRIN